MSKKKIAILGGGMGSLTTAFWLASQPDWQNTYEVTIYQLGWRLDGKLWNGRDTEIAYRDDEHGHHILFGFYRNVFDMMQRCYAELGRNTDIPISQFFAPDAGKEQQHQKRYAIKRNRSMYMAQKFADNYKTIPIRFPSNSQVPTDVNSVTVLKTNILAWLNQLMPITSRQPLQFIVQQVVQFGLSIIQQRQRTGTGTPYLMKLCIPPLRTYLRYLWHSSAETIETDWNVYLRWVITDLIVTTVIGLIEDDVLNHGLDSLNHINFCDWLRKHETIHTGTTTTLGSTVVEFAYTILFAFRDGDVTSPPTAEKPYWGQPNVETGTLLRFLMRVVLDYQGAATWTFEVNAGDAIVAPLYQVLKERGVKFKFFHKVKDLHLTNDQKCIERITVERQVDLTVDAYNPLIEVKGVPTWPSKPLYEQIQPEQAQILQQDNVDLESHWTDWTGTEFELQLGHDFDEVVLGIPVSALRSLTNALADANPAWNAMLNQIETVRCFGIQTWMTTDLRDLGWHQSTVLSNTGVRPVTLRADSSHLISWEDWPDDQYPQNRTYFGGFMPDDPDEPAPPAPDYPASQNAIIKQIASDFFGMVPISTGQTQ